jgi:hypothetical protein
MTTMDMEAAMMVDTVAQSMDMNITNIMNNRDMETVRK